MKKSNWDKWEEEGVLSQKLLLVEGWAREGATQSQIAQNLGIDESTFYNYLKKYEPLKKAVQKGKEVVDFAVENALFKNAMEGNVTAQIFWLCNRKRNKWQQRVKQDVEHLNEQIIIVDDISKVKKE